MFASFEQPNWLLSLCSIKAWCFLQREVQHNSRLLTHYWVLRCHFSSSYDNDLPLDKVDCGRIHLQVSAHVLLAVP